MIKNNPVFRFFCILSCFVLTSFASLPLASLLAHPDKSALDPAIAYSVTKEEALTDAPVQETAASNPPAPSAPPPVVLLPDIPTSDLAIDNQPFYDTLTLSERQSSGLPTALPSVTFYHAPKVVYLTFDDGPDPENTPRVLSILREAGVKATFFVVGLQAERHPNLIRSEFLAGHAIGNHTYNHIYKELYSSPSAYIGQLSRTDEIIKRTIGVRPRISRAPGGVTGHFTKAYWAALGSAGYLEFGWNISSGDASSAVANELTGNIYQQINNPNLWSHAIILMHDGPGHAETVKALPDIIRLLKGSGFEFRVINLKTPPAW